MSQGPQVKLSEDRRLLVERLAASSYFSRSARLRDLLVYLTDRVLEGEAPEIHEQEVGHQVFGRERDYDTAADNIVRVHASMLRKRLEQYFAGEGASEPVIIEIPRGNYAPLFRQRSKLTVEPLPIAEAVPAAAKRDWRLAVALACAGLFALSTALLLVRAARVPATPAAGGPTVRLFWSQILRPDRATDVVVDDAAVALYQELTGHAISLNEYFDRSYLRNLAGVASAAGLDPEIATSTILRRQSSFADTSFSWRLLQLVAGQSARPNLRFARDYSFRELKANNAILLGNGRSNPWIQSFEPQMGVRWQFDRTDGVYYPVDAAHGNRPFTLGHPGEAHEGYFSVVLVPNLSGTGDVLVVSATGGSATNAAADFLGDERWMHELRQRLPEDKGRGFPPFEALVKAQSRGAGSREMVIAFVSKK